MKFCLFHVKQKILGFGALHFDIPSKKVAKFLSLHLDWGAVTRARATHFAALSISRIVHDPQHGPLRDHVSLSDSLSL